MKYFAKTQILDGEETTEPGVAIELSEEAAAPLLAIGAIAEVGTEIEGTGAQDTGTGTPDPKEGPAKKASAKR